MIVDHVGAPPIADAFWQVTNEQNLYITVNNEEQSTSWLTPEG